MAGLDVVFDLAIDHGGCPGPSAPSGEAWLGPLGLANRLELELGLPRNHASPLARAMRLATSLAERPGFWTEPLGVDRLATAERMLADRDQLAMFGWNGEPASDRLAALWRATAGASPAMADRLARITAALAHRRASIASLRTFTPPDELPPRWRDVFAALARAGTDIVGCEPPHARGRVTLLRPHGPLTAADEVAAWLATTPDLASTVVIAPDATLSAACVRHGLPSLGALQPTGTGTLLSLCIESAFQPMDVANLHALICMDPGPIPRRLGWRLARALTRFPGRGNPLWCTALQEGLDALEPERRAEVSARIAALVDPVVALGGALTTDQLELRVASLVAWARPRIGVHPALGAVLAQAAAVVEIARAVGAPVELAELRRWVRAIPSPETCRTPAQHGLATVADPGAILAPPHRAIWWSCIRTSGPLIPRLRLSRAEREALAGFGIPIPEPATMTAHVAARWRRALAAAHLVLVAPRTTERGEPAHPHPLVDELAGIVATPVLDVPRSTTARRALPLPATTVQLAGPAGTLALESASSLESMLACSVAYVLRSRADLRTGLSAAVARPGPVLAGTLVHQLLANAFADGSTVDAVVRVSRAFDTELRQLAETLALPDHQAERAAVRRAARDAATAVCAIVASKGARIAGTEVRLTGSFAGLPVASTADLVLAEPAYVIDHKWGESSSRRRLASGAAVQLAIYASLVGADVALPDAGYLLLRTARLIGLAGDATPGIEVVPPHALRDIARATEHALAVRLAQLARGELVAPGADGSDGRSLLEGGMLRLAPECRYCALDGVCGRAGS